MTHLPPRLSLCPCGSGRAYRRCCRARDRAAEDAQRIERDAAETARESWRTVPPRTLSLVRENEATIRNYRSADTAHTFASDSGCGAMVYADDHKRLTTLIRTKYGANWLKAAMAAFPRGGR